MTTPAITYTAMFRRKQLTGSLQAISDQFNVLRDRSGIRASQFTGVTIYQGSVPVARLSYNGKVWPLGDWTPDMKPLI